MSMLRWSGTKLGVITVVDDNVDKEYTLNVLGLRAKCSIWRREDWGVDVYLNWIFLSVNPGT